MYKEKAMSEVLKVLDEVTSPSRVTSRDALSLFEDLRDDLDARIDALKYDIENEQ